jgi:HEPN domain-containing protein
MEPRGDINRRNLARAFYQRACEDRDVARLLLKEGKFADAALHSQQSGEKAIKSFLVTQNHFLTTHVVSGELSCIIEELNIPEGEPL